MDSAGAVLRPCEFDGSQDVSAPSFAVPPPRMAQKRRRIDDREERGSTSTAWETTEAAQRRHFGSAAFDTSINEGGAQHRAAVGSGEDAGTSTSMNEGSDRTVHWQGPGVSPYPDVASYSQQPYFYQQTHPSTYNSPWPPGDSTSFAAPSNTYSHTASEPPSNMPYFPSQAQTVTEDPEYETPDVRRQQAESALAQHNAHEAGFPYASRNENGLLRSDVPPEESAFLYEDASMRVKNQSLLILENLATQLIHTIASSGFPQILETMRGNDDEESQAYATLKSLFDQTRKVYSGDTPFIDAIQIQMFQPAQQETIRKANIATFLSSILGAHDVSFFHLNEFFTETFVPLGHRLLKWQGAVFLELKTQTYISALINSDGNPESMLDELFPSDLDAQILTRHPDAPSLSPSEQDFIERCRARRNYLSAEKSTDEALKELPKKYQWQDFVREFALSVSKNVDGLLNIPSRAQTGANDRKATNDPVSRSGAAGAKNSRLLSGPNGTSSQAREDGGKRIVAPGSTNPRQPWTKPEEEALMAGLEKVDGPHWSQILALYGRGGSVSEILKDRNQVQLKDKARNLKLWYLKTGRELPQALVKVTGELRKRGGARARAALDVADGDEQDAGDADGEGEIEGIEGEAGRNPSTRTGKAPVKRKSKKGS